MKYSSTEEWKNKVWHIHIMKYNSSIRKNEIMIPSTLCIYLVNSMLLLFSCQVMFNFLQPHGLHSRLPCPLPSSRVCSSSCLLNQWCHPTISSSVTLFSFNLQSFPASRSFPLSQLFTSGVQSIRASASASVLPMNIQGWFPLRLIGLISLFSYGLSRIISVSQFERINSLALCLLYCPALTSVQD